MALAREHGAPIADLGEVGGSTLLIRSGDKTLIDARTADLREPWATAIPRLVGEGIHQVALEGR